MDVVFPNDEIEGLFHGLRGLTNADMKTTTVASLNSLYGITNNTGSLNTSVSQSFFATDIGSTMTPQSFSTDELYTFLSHFSLPSRNGSLFSYGTSPACVGNSADNNCAEGK